MEIVAIAALLLAAEAGKDDLSEMGFGKLSHQSGAKHPLDI